MGHGILADEFGFTRRIRERKEHEKQAGRRALRWGSSFFLAYCILCVLGLTWYHYHQGDKTFVEALYAALAGFGAQFAFMGSTMAEAWPAFIIFMVVILCMIGLVVFFTRDTGQRQALTPLYRRMVLVQQTVEAGSPQASGGFQLALDALSDVLTFNPELHSKCVRFFDEMADGLTTQGGLEEVLALQRLLDSMGNAIEAAGERRNELLSQARPIAAQLAPH